MIPSAEPYGKRGYRCYGTGRSELPDPAAVSHDVGTIEKVHIPLVAVVIVDVDGKAHRDSFTLTSTYTNAIALRRDCGSSPLLDIPLIAAYIGSMIRREV